MSVGFRNPHPSEQPPLSALPHSQEGAAELASPELGSMPSMTRWQAQVKLTQQLGESLSHCCLYLIHSRGVHVHLTLACLQGVSATNPLSCHPANSISDMLCIVEPSMCVGLPCTAYTVQSMLAMHCCIRKSATRLLSVTCAAVWPHAPVQKKYAFGQ